MDGIIVINKPLGYTSRDIVNIVSKKLGTKKVGHTGTLDPKATGVMVLCVGKALKISELLTNHSKEYVAEVILGIETNTYDMDGNATILKKENVHLSEKDIIKAINSFKGKYMQEVPIYSSVKVNGKKLYEYARENKKVDLPKKEVTIEKIALDGNITYKDGYTYFNIKATVGKGTYIRSLVHDIGKKLDVPAVMNSLVRTRVGNFDISVASSLEDIDNNNFTIYKITDVLNDIPVISVNDNVAYKIKNGVSIKNLFDNDIAFLVDGNNNLLALYKNDLGVCKPYKMF